MSIFSWWGFGVFLMVSFWGIGFAISRVDSNPYTSNMTIAVMGLVGTSLFFGIIIGHFI